MGLGIPEAHVELDDPGCALRVYHQTDVEAAPIRHFLVPEVVVHRLDDLVDHPLEDCRGHHRGWCVRPHPSGIRSGVPLSDPLVVLAGRQANVAGLVHNDQD